MSRAIDKVFTTLLNFTGSLAHVAKISGRTKCISLKNELCIVRPGLISLNPEGLHYYRYQYDVSLNAFNMIAKSNQSDTLTKHIPCDFKCVSDGREFILNQKWNKDKCRCECRNYA